jgi:hypothetical protein
MTIVGLLDADLQEATEYRAGGIGPLFAQVRVEERFPIHEFLNRALRACRAARVTTVLNLFVDEIEVYRAGEDEVDNLERVLKLARDESIPAESTSFVLMLLHEDDNLVHVISVEASTDHPADEPAITVLDTADVPGGGEEEDDAWEAEADVADYADEPDQAEDDAAAKDLVRTFLERLLGELTRELSLSEPELDVWIDREGRYDFQLMYADALPPDAGPPQ